jgi:L-iditol 2-dehydrogenase
MNTAICHWRFFWEGAASKMTLKPGNLPCRSFGTSVERGAGTGFAFCKLFPAPCLSEIGGFFVANIPGNTMKAVTVTGVDSFVYENKAIPVPEPGQALVKVAITGLCRTDLKLIRSGHRDLILPRVPGEEVVGAVAALGPGVDSIAIGTRVYVYPGEWCGVCQTCLSGAENLCSTMRIMGFHRDGGFAEYVALPVKSLTPLDDSCHFSDAVFAEPLSCCINAIELSRLKAGEKIAIWGAGPAGTLLKRLAVHIGAHAVVIEPDKTRRVRCGGKESVEGEFFDVCIPAVGDGNAYKEATKHLAPRGRLVAFSGIPSTAEYQAADFNTLHYYEQTVVGAYGCSYRHGKMALDLITSGAVIVSDLVSHTMPLSQLSDALDMLAERRCMKIHLIPGE